MGIHAHGSTLSFHVEVRLSVCVLSAEFTRMVLMCVRFMCSLVAHADGCLFSLCCEHPWSFTSFLHNVAYENVWRGSCCVVTCRVHVRGCVGLLVV